MANTTVTNVQLKMNDAVEMAYTAATADTADLAETFEFTPTRAQQKLVFAVNNASALNGTLKAKFKSGAFFASIGDVEKDVAQGKVALFEIDTAKFKTATGKILVVLTPASGKKLKTDHTASIGLIQTV